MNSSQQHLSFEDLAAEAEGRGEKEQSKMNAHLTACSQCSEALDRLTHVIELMRTDDSESAPRDALAYARAIFQRTPASSILRRIVAALSFDSATAAPEFGMRSAQSTSHQLLFTAEEVDIDVRVLAQADNWVVSGQILGSSCAEGRVELTGAEKQVSAPLNDLCEFNLSPVGAGVYQLSLRLPDREIEIQNLRLGV